MCAPSRSMSVGDGGRRGTRNVLHAPPVARLPEVRPPRIRGLLQRTGDQGQRTKRALPFRAPQAPAGNPVPVPPRDVFAVARADLAALASAGGPAEAAAMRYFWAPETGAAWTRLRVAFRLHINLLSRRVAMADVAEVRADLWRLDLRDVLWPAGVLEQFQFLDVYFHRQRRLTQRTLVESWWPGGPDRHGQLYGRGRYAETRAAGRRVATAAPWLEPGAAIQARRIAYSEVPVLRAAQVLAVSATQRGFSDAATGVGYYDLLRLKNRDDFFRLIGLDEAASIRVRREIRAALEKSGVSPRNRQIVRLGAASGGAWGTLDTFRQSGRGVAIEFLARGEFRHQAEEWYGALPNSLPATFLANNKGVRQDFAPADAFGFGDHSPLNEGRDSRIHVNLACIRCHAGQVLQPIDDWVRATHQDAIGLAAKRPEDVLRARDQYFSDLVRRLERDRLEYTEAFAAATVTRAYPRGLTAQQAAEAYAGAFHHYIDGPVTVAIAARELGISAAEWLRVLRWHLQRSSLDLRLAPFLRGLALSRLTWESVYATAQDLAHGFVQKEGP